MDKRTTSPPHSGQAPQPAQGLNPVALLSTIIALAGLTVAIVAFAKGKGPAGEKGDKGDPGPSIEIGCIAAWPFPGDPPSGWLHCDGRIWGADDHLKLFNKMKEKDFPYNKKDDAGDNFRVPDFRGYFLRGVDDTDGDDDDSRDPAGRDQDERVLLAEKYVVGSTQAWATAIPRGENRRMFTNETGSHTHGGEGKGVFNITKTPAPKGEGPALDNKPELQTPIALISDGGHDHHLENGGDRETRPTNVAVAWIIFAGVKEEK